MLRSWLAKKLIDRNMAALNRGDPGPTLRMDAADVRFLFPGTSSFAGEVAGKVQLEAWLRRMIDTGLQHQVQELIVSGPPWNMTIVLRGTDHAEDADGKRVYENRYVIWGRTRWGLLKEYEVYEDTEKALAFDTVLAAR